MTTHATVRVDLGNRSATVVDTDGRWQGTWSGTTRSTAGDAIASQGWRFADSGWRMTIDGGVREVIR